MPSLKLSEIVDICQHGRAIQLFEPFLNHFGDIDYACILSEVCVNSAISVEQGIDTGWFRRTYEAWEKLTGIPATRVRKVCIDLASLGFIIIKVDKNASHFQAEPSAITVIMGDVIPNANRRKSLGSCPECGADVIEGKKSYFCSTWAKWKKDVCRFCIWKDTLLRSGKDLVTADEARRLLLAEEIDLPGLKNSVTNQPFSCKGILTKRKSGTYGIKFVFANRTAVKRMPEIIEKSSRQEAHGEQARSIAN